MGKNVFVVTEEYTLLPKEALRRSLSTERSDRHDTCGWYTLNQGTTGGEVCSWASYDETQRPNTVDDGRLLPKDGPLSVVYAIIWKFIAACLDHVA